MRTQLIGFIAALVMAGCAVQHDASDDRFMHEPVNVYPIFPAAKALEDLAATSANASVGDLNGDGNLDVLLVKGRHWPLEDRVLFGDGTGAFAAAVNLSGISDRSYSGLLADLDLDGDLDIVVSNDRPDPSLVYLNDGKRCVRGRFNGRQGRMADQKCGRCGYEW